MSKDKNINKTTENSFYKEWYNTSLKEINRWVDLLEKTGFIIYPKTNSVPDLQKSTLEILNKLLNAQLQVDQLEQEASWTKFEDEEPLENLKCIVKFGDGSYDICCLKWIRYGEFKRWVSENKTANQSKLLYQTDNTLWKKLEENKMNTVTEIIDSLYNKHIFRSDLSPTERELLEGLDKLKEISSWTKFEDEQPEMDKLYNVKTIWNFGDEYTKEVIYTAKFDGKDWVTTIPPVQKHQTKNTLWKELE